MMGSKHCGDPSQKKPRNFKRTVVGVVIYLIAGIGSGGVGVVVMVEVG